MSEKEIIDKLSPYSDYDVIVYRGDDDLISSINAEYSLDSNEFIVTDGAVITSINKATFVPRLEMVKAENGVCKITAIRGCTYLIIGEYQDNKCKISIRVDESKMNDEKIKEIISKVNYFKKDNDVEYYINNYNTNGVYKSADLLFKDLL